MDTQFSSDETESSDISELEAPEADSTDMSELEPPESKLIDKPRAEKKAAEDSKKPFRSQEPEACPQKKQKRLESLGQQRRGSRHRGGARKRSH